MYCKPPSHDHHTLLDCQLQVLPLDISRSLEAKRYAIQRALQHPDCFCALPEMQRSTLITNALALGMADACARLTELDHCTATHVPHPVTSPVLCMPCVVPRPSIAAITFGLLLLSSVLVFAIFSPQ